MSGPANIAATSVFCSKGGIYFVSILIAVILFAWPPATVGPMFSNGEFPGQDLPGFISGQPPTVSDAP